MRLSLQVARKFFDLQDMLGYDKASKTIEWLLSKSKKAMKDLTNTKDGKSESFASECEVVSRENCSKNEGVADCNESSLIGIKPTTRETREKAKAKALCRTEEKVMVKRVESSPNQNVLEKLGSSSSSPPLDRERVCVADCAPSCTMSEQSRSFWGVPLLIITTALVSWDFLETGTCLSNDHRLN
ncbi:hypothetical protein SASPL_156414 [Salvia splendens]|uniref:TCP domain-containing protein n=1 Tax=Salvia splendens TaxID=180675 RepID=A0A8X8YX70_SALSN|nr:transcription factor DICHOTOMA-like [Salvia splendens]KAG6383818.1 hypothetical protein SASPL_156414 [Salvia splendens]